MVAIPRCSACAAPSRFEMRLAPVGAAHFSFYADAESRAIPHAGTGTSSHWSVRTTCHLAATPRAGSGIYAASCRTFTRPAVVASLREITGALPKYRDGAIVRPQRLSYDHLRFYIARKRQHGWHDTDRRRRA